MAKPITFYTIINLTCLLILGIIFFSTNRKKKIIYSGSILFKLTIIFVAVVLVFDWGMWFIDAKTFKQAYMINQVVTFCYYLFGPVVSLVWLLFLGIRIYGDYKTVCKKVLPIGLIPIVLNIVACILNIKFKFMYSISLDNIYHRESFMYISVLLVFFDVVYSIILMLINYSELLKRELYSFIAFFIIPTICGVIQYYIYGLNIIWLGVTIAILLVYVFAINEAMQYDPLTGLSNRNQLENYLDVLLSRHKRDKLLIAYILNLSNFKSINRKFGHSVGDKAIENSADILREAFGKKAFISRYAGVEFVVIVREDNEREIEIARNNLELEEIKYNSTSNKPYMLKFSFNYIIYRGTDILTTKRILDTIDQKGKPE